jgi:hypothetical protein
MMSWELKIILSFVFAIIMLGIAVLMVGLALWRTRKAAAARQWPSVPGEIITSEVLASPGSEGGTSYSPKIVYRYQLGGQTYESRRLSVARDWEGWPESRIRSTVNQYPVGQKVQVYYNPQNTDDAVLMHARPGVAWLYAIAAMCLCSGPTLLAVNVFTWWNSR